MLILLIAPMASFYKKIQSFMKKEKTSGKLNSTFKFLYYNTNKIMYGGYYEKTDKYDIFYFVCFV
jgi:hypothetical protein